jgi:hypothetical protein
MVSIPLIPSDPRKTSIFPTAVSSAFSYESGYVPNDTLQNGIGYWVKFSSDQDVPIFGDTLTADTVEISDDWNMVGSISSPVAVSSLTSIPGGIVTSEFFGYSGSYSAADTLRPGKGYWVKASQSGQIVLSSSAASPANRIRIVHTSEMPPPAPSDGVSGSESAAPAAFELFQNYPNPFNPSTVIRYQLPASGHVSLKIFNTNGEEVASLIDEEQSAGFRSVTWTADHIASGVYFYRLKSGSTELSRKLLLIK